jgi:AcrR family transcriptional regulator
VSRSEIENTPYHHGDLRNALIAAGVRMLATGGEQTLSLRQLAREAGVSHNAPYMHFADKEALLAAVAEEGFGLLAEQLNAALTAAGSDWPLRLQAGSWAYVQFALDHPAHFNVMFRDYELDQYPSYFKASLEALAILEALVVAGQAEGLVRAGDSRQLATLVWSLLHGLATILAGRKMPPVVMGDITPQALVAQQVQQLYAGLAPPGHN